MTARDLQLAQSGVVRVLRPLAVRIIARLGDPPVDSLRVAPGDTVFVLYQTAEGWNWGLD